MTPRRGSGAPVIVVVLVIAAAIVLIPSYAILMAFGKSLPPFGTEDDDVPFPTTSAPPGMQAESFGYFAFAVPQEWQEQCVGGITCSPTWVDANGEPMMTATFGSILGCPEPDHLEDVGHRGDGSQVHEAKPTDVPGAGGAYRYVVTGTPAGDAIKLYAWLPSCSESLTLTVFASEDVADDISATVLAEDPDAED